MFYWSLKSIHCFAVVGWPSADKHSRGGTAEIADDPNNTIVETQNDRALI